VTAATSCVRQTHHFKVLVGSTSVYGVCIFIRQTVESVPPAA